MSMIQQAYARACVQPTPLGQVDQNGAPASAAPDTINHGLVNLLTRRSTSVKHLTDPGPNDEQLSHLIAAAHRAPNHGQLDLFRCVLVRGPARMRLAQLFVSYAIRSGKNGEIDHARERERVLAVPVIIAMMAKIDHSNVKVPAHEQWMSLGGAVTNLLNAAHALGFAGKILSGKRVADPEIAANFCGPGEALVGWISLGTAKNQVAQDLRCLPISIVDWSESTLNRSEF